jgi:LysR family hydrogen peroxide-inducible transcriptional activator
LRASSLETLIQLVSAGFGITLIPALAMQGSWTTGSGVVAQPLTWPDASRRISLVYRHSFPRQAALQALAGIIVANLPNTVKPLMQGKANNKTAHKKS